MLIEMNSYVNIYFLLSVYIDDTIRIISFIKNDCKSSYLKIFLI